MSEEVNKTQEVKKKPVAKKKETTEQYQYVPDKIKSRINQIIKLYPEQFAEPKAIKPTVTPAQQTKNTVSNKLRKTYSLEELWKCFPNLRL